MTLFESIKLAYQSLFEASKTRKLFPEHYENISKYAILEKYSGPEYSIRFSQSWEDSSIGDDAVSALGSGKIINKVGINTKRSWGNP